VRTQLGRRLQGGQTSSPSPRKQSPVPAAQATSKPLPATSTSLSPAASPRENSSSRLAAYRLGGSGGTMRPTHDGGPGANSIPTSAASSPGLDWSSIFSQTGGALLRKIMRVEDEAAEKAGLRTPPRTDPREVSFVSPLSDATSISFAVSPSTPGMGGPPSPGRVALPALVMADAVLPAVYYSDDDNSLTYSLMSGDASAVPTTTTTTTTADSVAEDGGCEVNSAQARVEAWVGGIEEEEVEVVEVEVEVENLPGALRAQLDAGVGVAAEEAAPRVSQAWSISVEGGKQKQKQKRKGTGRVRTSPKGLREPVREEVEVVEETGRADRSLSAEIAALPELSDGDLEALLRRVEEQVALAASVSSSRHAAATAHSEPTAELPLTQGGEATRPARLPAPVSPPPVAEAEADATGSSPQPRPPTLASSAMHHTLPYYSISPPRRYPEAVMDISPLSDDIGSLAAILAAKDEAMAAAVVPARMAVGGEDEKDESYDFTMSPPTPGPSLRYVSRSCVWSCVWLMFCGSCVDGELFLRGSPSSLLIFSSSSSSPHLPTSLSPCRSPLIDAGQTSPVAAAASPEETFTKAATLSVEFAAFRAHMAKENAGRTVGPTSPAYP